MQKNVPESLLFAKDVTTELVTQLEVTKCCLTRKGSIWYKEICY